MKLFKIILTVFTIGFINNAFATYANVTVVSKLNQKIDVSLWADNVGYFGCSTCRGWAGGLKNIGRGDHSFEVGDGKGDSYEMKRSELVVYGSSGAFCKSDLFTIQHNQFYKLEITYVYPESCKIELK